MRLLLRIVIFLSVLFPPLAGQAAPPVHVYICAHPDDCVLFMHPDLYTDIAGQKDKTVMIYVTAGDAGEAWNESKASYPYGREQAALLATDWMGTAEREKPGEARRAQRVRRQRHTVYRVQSGLVASYFLRLPDGNMDGDGFARYGHQSLQKLKIGAIPTLDAVDHTAHYRSWDDLVDTLGAIIGQEAAGSEAVTLHFADTDMQANHDDHSDHQRSAQAVLQWLEAERHCYVLTEHLDYAIADLPPNLDAISARNATATFAVLTALQQQNWGYHHWNEAHTRYLERGYSRHRLSPGCPVESEKQDIAHKP